MMNEPKLKAQFKLVAKYYVGECCGNAEKSCVKAGYSKKYARGNAYKIVARDDVQEYIAYLRQNIDGSRDIMEVEDIQEFWTGVIKDTREKTRDRLRASELLAKSKDMFVSEW